MTDFKIRNNQLQRLASFLEHFFLANESTISWLKRVPIKRAAKTIMLREDTSATLVEKGKIWKKGRTCCMAGAPNDAS